MAGLSVLASLFGRRSSNIVEQQIMQALNSEEIGRLNKFKRAWSAYCGQYPRVLKVRAGQPDDNVLPNYARVIVDKGVSFLFGQDVAFELSETEQTEAEDWLAACWQANRQATFLHKLALNGAICGHAFVKIVPREGQFPRLVILDPATVTPFWNPDDIEDVVAYRIQYPAVDPSTGKPISVRQIIDRRENGWHVLDQVAQADSAAWTTTSEMAWPYDWPPIVGCQNLPAPNEYWGISDLEDDILGLQGNIHFLLSNLARIIRYHGHPKTVAKGVNAAQLNVAVDETIVLPSPEADLRNLEMTSDLSGSINLIRLLEEAMHEIARVPEIATGKVESIGALSGVALQILYQPLLEKTETKRRTYGDMLTELNRRLLALAGFGEDNETTIHWPELLPRDPLQERQAALLDQQLGVSTDTILQRLGYDPDLERTKRQLAAEDAAVVAARMYNRGA